MDDNKGKVEMVPPNAEINITVGFGLYTRLQQLMFHKAQQKSVEDFQKMLERLKNGGKAENLYEYEIETYLSLIYEIEVKGKEQNQLAYVDPSEVIKPE